MTDERAQAIVFHAHEIEFAERFQLAGEAPYARPVLDHRRWLPIYDDSPQVVEASAVPRGGWDVVGQSELGDTRQGGARYLIVEGADEQQMGVDGLGQRLQEVGLANAAAAQISIRRLRRDPEGPPHPVGRFPARSSSSSTIARKPAVKLASE